MEAQNVKYTAKGYISTRWQGWGLNIICLILKTVTVTATVWDVTYSCVIEELIEIKILVVTN